MTGRVTIDQEETHLAVLVRRGGGEWVGIQRIRGAADLVLFNAPSGTTLSLPVGQISPEAVARRIEESRTRSC